MPLVVLTGGPAVGKSAVAARIKAKLESTGKHAHVVSEDSLKLPRSTVFSGPGTEKQARGAVTTAVDRLLASDTFVIADAMNYIKGYRYQLWCLCKEGTGPCCVVHVRGSLAKALQNNAARPDGPSKYAPGVIEALWKRLEPPSESDRWERPLFVVEATEDEHGDHGIDGADRGTSADEGGTQPPRPPVTAGASSFMPAASTSSFAPASSSSSFTPARDTSSAFGPPGSETDSSVARHATSGIEHRWEEDDAWASGGGGSGDGEAAGDDEEGETEAQMSATKASLDNPEQLDALANAVVDVLMGKGGHGEVSTAEALGLPDDLLAAAEAPGETHPDAVLQAVARALPRAAPGERVVVPGSAEPVVLARVPARGELSALRRAFRNGEVGRATEGRGLDLQAAAAFARFLTIALQS